MNLKSKIFGSAATTVLALSITTGAMAQTASDTVSGSVVLAPGMCKIAINEADVNFGTWTWQGTAYAHTGGSNVSTINGTLYPAKPSGLCDITVQSNGINGPSGDISITNFTGSVGGSPFMTIPTTDLALEAGETFEDVSAGPGFASLKLNSVPNTYQPGTYSGTVSFTVNAAS